ncbi:MAG: hypothetical protein O3C40_24890 [Planctomycetota bacterium]|nr:hypothetical protein [Planctomycetota bacterium]
MSTRRNSTTQHDSTSNSGLGRIAVGIPALLALAAIGIEGVAVLQREEERQLFVNSAIGTVSVSAAMMLLGLVGGLFVHFIRATWLRVLAYSIWVLLTALLLTVFLVPGWSYQFPFSPIELTSLKTSVVIAGVFLKYVAVVLVVLAAIVCLTKRQRLLAGLAVTVVAVAFTSVALMFPKPFEHFVTLVFHNPKFERLLASVGTATPAVDAPSSSSAKDIGNISSTDSEVIAERAEDPSPGQRDEVLGEREDGSPDSQPTEAVPEIEPSLLLQSAADPSQPLPTSVDSNPDLEKPIAVECWPLVRKGIQTVWHSSHDDSTTRTLGFIDHVDTDDETHYFRPALAPLTQAKLLPVSKGELKQVASVLDAWAGEEYWVERVAWSTAEQLSIPEGRCLEAPIADGLTRVSLPESELVRAGTRLHVVGLLPKPHHRGIVTVKETLPDQSTVEVPNGMRIQAGDWIFPVIAERQPPTIAIVLERRVPRSPSHPIEAVDRAVLELEDRLKLQISDRLIGLGAKVVDRFTGAPSSFALTMAVRPTAKSTTVIAQAQLQRQTRFGQEILFTDTADFSVTRSAKDMPTILITERLACYENLKRTRFVRWFDEAMFYPSSLPSKSEWDPSILLQKERSLDFRDLFSNSHSSTANSDILDGSLEWIETEDDLKRELPYDRFIAWKIAREVCLPRIQVLRPGTSEMPALLWTGSQSLEKLGITKKNMPPFVASEKPWHFLEIRPSENPFVLEARIPPGKKLEEDDLVCLGDPPWEKPRLVFLDTVEDSRRIKWSLFNGAFIDKEIHTRISSDRWGKTLNSRIQDHLKGLGIRLVGSPVLDDLRRQSLFLPHAPVAMISNRNTLRQYFGDITHVVHTHLAFHDRSDGARLTVSLIDYTGSERGSQILEEASINVEDIFPDEMTPVYRRAPFLVRGTDLVIFSSRGKTAMGHLIQKAEPTALVRHLVDESIEIVRANLEPFPKYSDRDIDELYPSYEATIDRVAFLIMQEVCPKACRITDPGQRTIDLGSLHGLKEGDRLRVTRYQAAVGKERPIGQVRAQRVRRTTSTIAFPPAVSIESGDLVTPLFRPRIHLAVDRLQPNVPVGFPPDIHPACKLISEKVPQALADRLQLSGIPMLTDLDMLAELRNRLFGPRLSDVSAVETGRAFGATHILTGTVAPDGGSNNRFHIELELTDVQTGSSNRLPSVDVNIKNVK